MTSPRVAATFTIEAAILAYVYGDAQCSTLDGRQK